MMAPDALHEIVFDHYDPADERSRESLFLLGNGIISVRSCATDAVTDDKHYAGTYRAGCYNRLADEVEGEPVENESLVNLPNWLPLTFRVADETEWFSLDAVEILSYRHALNLQHGTAHRTVLFDDGKGRKTQLTERRLVSMTQPHLAALRLELVPENWSGTVEIRSALDGNVINEAVERYHPYDRRHLEIVRVAAEDPNLILVEARTRQSRIRIAVASRICIATHSSGSATSRTIASDKTSISDHVTSAVQSGTLLAIEKTAAIFTSRDWPISEPCEAALASVRSASSFAELRDDHLRAWERLWQQCRIEIAHDDLARPSKLHAFHILQTVSPHSSALDVGFPSRGLQEAYHGQIFWDEVFAFPFLNLRLPSISRALLLYRYRRLDAARAAARRHGYRGAMFPWRSASTGQEVTPAFQLNPLSGSWMRDHTHLQHHIGAVIAYNVWQYFLATGDMNFLADCGAEMIVEIARFWASAARFDTASGRYDIRGVVGPDEYHIGYPNAASPGIDNNAFTNVMAAWTLRRALELFDHLPRQRSEEIRRFLRLTSDELELWDRVARKLRLCFHDNGVISQFEGFEHLRRLDLAAFEQKHPGQRVDWAMESDGDDANAYQVVKQADVLMLLHLLPLGELAGVLGGMGYDLTCDELRRTANHYLERTVHESSLSHMACAGALARLDPALSWRMYREALHPDAKTGHSGTDEGIHLGAMASSLDVLQRHYLGIRPSAEGLEIDPALPSDLGRISMDFQYRSAAFTIETAERRVKITSDPGNRSAMNILNRGRSEKVRPGATVSLALDGPDGADIDARFT